MAVNKKDAAAGLASAVALISGAQLASAADVDMSVPANDWSGFYLGLSAGLQWGDAPTSYDNDYKMSGDIAFGGFAGVNQQYGDFVVGAELALQTGNDFKSDDSSYDYDLNYTADAKIKLGMDVGHDILIYGFGGFFASGINVGTSLHDYATFGVNYGVGAEMMVTEQFSLGAELIGRTPIDDYGWDDNKGADPSYQASLRAAFHF